MQNGTFPGTALTNCQKLASDIKHCQRKGVLVTLSIGGALGNSSLNDSNAREFAETVWDLFLGGCSDTRPFGSAVLDGWVLITPGVPALGHECRSILLRSVVYRIDLDIENGSPTGYTTFIEKIRCLASDAEKKFVGF